ncbi:MAG: glycosyltransferase family 4 protein [Solirubrobacteraceae bacterium]
MAVFSASGLGGSELFNLEFLRRARACGCRVEALVPADGPLVAALEPIAERVLVVPIPSEITALSRFDRRGGGAARAFVRLPEYRRRFDRMLRQTHGALACMGFRSQLACAVTPAARARPRCWVVHEVVPAGPFGVAWGLAARGADLVVTYSMSAALQPMLRLAHPRVLGVRFDLTAFAALPAPPTRPRTVGLVGDLFELKNHRGLIEVVRRLRERGEDVDGVLIGRETAAAGYAQSVRLAVAATGDSVTLRAVRPGEMPAALADIDCLLQLSTVPESFGRVCVEAMAAGRPVVAFDHGGVSELVDDGVTGVLCAPGDLDAVTAAVRRMRGDPELFARLSQAARRVAAERWSSAREGETIGDALARFAVQVSPPA